MRRKNNINITKMFQCYKASVQPKPFKIHLPLPNKLVHMREGAEKYGRRIGTVLSRTWSIRFFKVICSKEAILIHLSMSWIDWLNEQTKWSTSVSSAISTNMIFCFESLFCSLSVMIYILVCSVRTLRQHSPTLMKPGTQLTLHWLQKENERNNESKYDVTFSLMMNTTSPRLAAFFFSQKIENYLNSFPFLRNTF